MKYSFYLSICLIALFSCGEDVSIKGQKGKDSGFVMKSPSEYFPKDKAKILVVGTFHMDYPDLDFIKSTEESRIDVLAEPKKSEMTELVAYIKKFKPNKIAIEAWPEWEATKKLRQYKTGKLPESRDERVQIAMRIAADLALDTLYSIDSRSIRKELRDINPTYIEKMYEDYDYRSDDKMQALIMKWRMAEDKNIPKVNLLEYFKFMNTRESHEYSFGVYLTGDFKLGEGRGADALTVGWYNRNLRIFAKIQSIIQEEDDRILVLFGNGHAAILRHLIECSPEYDFVEFGEL